MKPLRRKFRFRVSQKTLVEAFSMLMAEYSELCGDRYNHNAAEMQVFLLQMQVKQLAVLINLSHNPKERDLIISEISALCGTENIKEAKSILDLWMLDLRAAEKRFEEELKKAKEEKTALGLYGLVTEINRSQLFQLDVRRTTVMEFAAHMVSFKRHVEFQKAQATKQKKHNSRK